MLVGDELDHTQNEIQPVGVVPFEEWRVVGLGLICTEATTDNEAPIVHFGVRGDVDCFGIVTVTATAAKCMQLDEYTSVDQYGIIVTDDLATDSLIVTWTEAATGSIYNVWQTTMQKIQAKSIATVTTGKWIPFALIEVNSKDKY